MPTLAPLVVEYCALCTCPLEYCENAGCKRVALALEKEMADVSVSGASGEEKPAESGKTETEPKTDADAEPKKDDKKKKSKAKGVTITRTNRNKKKTITNVAGFENFPEVDIKGTYYPKRKCTAYITYALFEEYEIRTSRPTDTFLLIVPGRLRRPPSRPIGGWGLMVVPMAESKSKKTHARAKREGWTVQADAPFVAYPDGTKREINDDEKVMFARRRNRPVRKTKL